MKPEIAIRASMRGLVLVQQNPYRAKCLFVISSLLEDDSVWLSLKNFSSYLFVTNYVSSKAIYPIFKIINESHLSKRTQLHDKQLFVSLDFQFRPQLRVERSESKMKGDLLAWCRVFLLTLLRPLVASRSWKAKKLSKGVHQSEQDDKHQHLQEFVADAQSSADEREAKVDSSGENEESLGTETEEIFVQKSNEEKQLDEISRLRQLVEKHDEEKQFLIEMEARNLALSVSLSREKAEFEDEARQFHRMREEFHFTFRDSLDDLKRKADELKAKEKEIDPLVKEIADIKRVIEAHRARKQVEEGNRKVENSVRKKARGKRQLEFQEENF